jgi:prepilin signal peptidase PulO-like enzyme (type II secretory pathway)
MSTDSATLWLRTAAPLFTLLAGMAFASFIGSLSYRRPRGVSIVAPRSYCSSCGRPIRPFDLVPVVSYLLLRGRCRACGAAIPIQYFAAEVLLPVAYLLMYLRFAPGPEFFVYSYLMSVLLYLSLLDIDWREVGVRDAVLPYGGAFALLALSMLGALPDPVSHYLSGAAASGALAGLSCLLVRLVRKRLPMGAADLIVIPAVGFHFGVMGALRVMVFSSLIGVIVGVVVAAAVGNREARLPMLPFLAGGVLGEVLWELLRLPF